MYRYRVESCSEPAARPIVAAGAGGLAAQLEARIEAICLATPTGSQRLQAAMRCSMLVPGKRARIRRGWLTMWTLW